MNNNEKFLVHAIRFDENGKIIAVLTNMSDSISIEQMKSLIAIKGFEFYIIGSTGKEIPFEFEDDKIKTPDEKELSNLDTF